MHASDEHRRIGCDVERSVFLSTTDARTSPPEERSARKTMRNTQSHNYQLPQHNTRTPNHTITNFFNTIREGKGAPPYRSTTHTFLYSLRLVSPNQDRMGLDASRT